MFTFMVVATLLGGQTAAAPPQQGKTPAASAAIPNTGPGKALTDFVATFNEGGEKRRAWVEGRTDAGKADAADILQQDARFLGEHGPVTIVRVAKAGSTGIEAVLKHAKSGAHGYLTLETDGKDPYTVTNMQIRPATEAEIKGSDE